VVVVVVVVVVMMMMMILLTILETMMMTTTYTRTMTMTDDVTTLSRVPLTPAYNHARRRRDGGRTTPNQRPAAPLPPSPSPSRPRHRQPSPRRRSRRLLMTTMTMMMMMMTTMTTRRRSTARRRWRWRRPSSRCGMTHTRISPFAQDTTCESMIGGEESRLRQKKRFSPSELTRFVIVPA
jgi:hypothetical protein